MRIIALNTASVSYAAMAIVKSSTRSSKSSISRLVTSFCLRGRLTSPYTTFNSLVSFFKNIIKNYKIFGNFWELSNKSVTWQTKKTHRVIPMDRGCRKNGGISGDPCRHLVIGSFSDFQLWVHLSNETVRTGGVTPMIAARVSATTRS